MNKTLLLSLVLIIGFSIYAETQEDTQPVEEETHRSRLIDTADMPHMSLYDKCILGGKGFGAGTLAAFFAGCGYLSSKEAAVNGLFEKNHTFSEKAGLVCMAGAAFVLAAKMCGVSYDSLSVILKG